MLLAGCATGFWVTWRRGDRAEINAVIMVEAHVGQDLHGDLLTKAIFHWYMSTFQCFKMATYTSFRTYFTCSHWATQKQLTTYQKTWKLWTQFQTGELLGNYEFAESGVYCSVKNTLTSSISLYKSLLRDPCWTAYSCHADPRMGAGTMPNLNNLIMIFSMSNISVLWPMIIRCNWETRTWKYLLRNEDLLVDVSSWQKFS
jgi:hypothetical protein